MARTPTSLLPLEHLLPLLQFIVLTLLQIDHVSGTQCYNLDGTVSNDQPCNARASASLCCPPGYLCTSQNLCQPPGGWKGTDGNPIQFLNGSCTDKTWRASECQELLSLSYNFSIPYVTATVEIVAPTTTASTAASEKPTKSNSPATSGSSSNSKIPVAVGIGVGVGVGIVLFACVVGFIVLRLRRRRMSVLQQENSAEGAVPELGDSYRNTTTNQHGGVNSTVKECPELDSQQPRTVAELDAGFTSRTNR